MDWLQCLHRRGGGVKIGNGAIIGAGCRITKDVPPYAVMIKDNEHLRNRFPDEIMELMLRLRWWDWDECFIKENIRTLSENPSKENVFLLMEKYQKYKESKNH